MKKNQWRKFEKLYNELKELSKEEQRKLLTDDPNEKKTNRQLIADYVGVNEKTIDHCKYIKKNCALMFREFFLWRQRPVKVKTFRDKIEAAVEIEQEELEHKCSNDINKAFNDLYKALITIRIAKEQIIKDLDQYNKFDIELFEDILFEFNNELEDLLKKKDKIALEHAELIYPNNIEIPEKPTDFYNQSVIKY